MLGRRLYKTKLCVLWQRGRCSRPFCNFAHGEAELRRFPSSSLPHGRREFRGGDFGDRSDRRYSPRRRYSPGRDLRAHRPIRDERPRDRGSSMSRSPVRMRYRKKQPNDSDSDSSGSSKNSDGDEDKRKEEKLSNYDEKDELEGQLKQFQLDIENLRYERSQLETVLDERVDKAHKLAARIEDLELQISREQDECRRITSKLKKFVKANSRYIKAQDELKRSQARLQRLSDSLGLDISKSSANEDLSANVADDDLFGDYQVSSDDQLKNHVSSKKRPLTQPAREEAKTGERKKGKHSEWITRFEKDNHEGNGTEPYNIVKGSEMAKSFFFKTEKPGDDKYIQRNFNSGVRGSEMKLNLPSTGMAAHAAVEELIEAIEMEEKSEHKENAVVHENGDHDGKIKASFLPLPIVRNAYKEYEGDDEEVDVEKVENDIIGLDLNAEVESLI